MYCLLGKRPHWNIKMSLHTFFTHLSISNQEASLTEHIYPILTQKETIFIPKVAAGRKGERPSMVNLVPQGF